MRSYAKRLSQKVEKLSKEQLIDLLEKIVDENESRNSILESLSSGLMIVDNNFILQQSNTILESRLTFKNHNEDKKTLPVWDLLEDEEIAAYFKKCKAN